METTQNTPREGQVVKSTRSEHFGLGLVLYVHASYAGVYWSLTEKPEAIENAKRFARDGGLNHKASEEDFDTLVAA